MADSDSAWPAGQLHHGPAPTDSVAQDLMGRINAGQALMGVIGLGYVGLPLALAAIEVGYRVLGFDINTARVAAITAGERVISYVDPTSVREAIRQQRFDGTTDMSRLGQPDVVVICVPTPVTRNRDPDLSFVIATAEAIAEQLRPGQLIVLESTTWPGTTREIVQPILERRGLRAGRDFFLAFSPEREDPGNPVFGTRSIPKVVGADDPLSKDLAVAFYGRIMTTVVPLDSAAAAEATKLTENIFRAVNIALVNELKVVFQAMGIDVWDVINAAATKPFGFQPFYPGPGLGGHCIPVDPFYLSWKAREFGLETRFVELAGHINTNMPRQVVDSLADALSRTTGKGLRDARVLVIGVAYKRNVDDTRESPSLVLMEQLEQRGAHCDFHDPHIASIPATREHPQLAGRCSVALDAVSLATYDVVLISTDHDLVDYELIADQARLIVDTRNVIARLGLSNARVVKA